MTITTNLAKGAFVYSAKENKKKKRKPILNQRKPRKTVNTFNRNTAMRGVRELINQHDFFFSISVVAELGLGLWQCLHQELVRIQAGMLLALSAVSARNFWWT